MRRLYKSLIYYIWRLLIVQLVASLLLSALNLCCFFILLKSSKDFIQREVSVWTGFLVKLKFLRVSFSVQNYSWYCICCVLGHHPGQQSSKLFLELARPVGLKYLLILNPVALVLNLVMWMRDKKLQELF